VKNRIVKAEEYKEMEAEKQTAFRAEISTLDHLFTITQGKVKSVR